MINGGYSYRVCEVLGKKALFHRWNEKAKVIGPDLFIGGAPGGQLKETYGIVEFEDGSIVEVLPYQIKFKDNIFKNYCFDQE